MSSRLCIDCGQPFEYGPGETWKVRCLDCWRRRKRGFRPPAAPDAIDYRALWRRADAEAYRLSLRVADLERELANKSRSPIEAELRDNLTRLMQCCHPDKHGNSTAATVATQWLLNVRQRLNS